MGEGGNAFLLAATNPCQWVSLRGLSLSLLLESTKVKDGGCYPQVGFFPFLFKKKKKVTDFFFICYWIEEGNI